MPQLSRALLPLFLVLSLTAAAWAEVCKGNKVPKAELAGHDQQLTLTDAERDRALETHGAWGTARCPRLLSQREYLVCYDPDNRVALWVSYQLRREDVVQRDRRDAFRTDPRLTDAENAHCADYAGTGYDRGHIVPRGDMNRTAEAQAYTFFLSNMTPQTPALNRGMWRWLEELVRAYAEHYGEVSVFAGAVFQDARTLPSGNVAIPTRLYKVLVRRTDGDGVAVLAFLLPNRRGLPVPPGTRGVPGRRITAEEADVYLVRRLVSVEHIEHLTGLTLLPRLEGDDLRKAVASELWPKN